MNGGFRVASISVALQLLYRVCFVREHCNEAEINAGRGEKEKKQGMMLGMIYFAQSIY